MADLSKELSKELNKDFAYCEDALGRAENAIGNLPAAQQEQRWIPCSDENPKADGRYLITGKMGTVYSLDFEDGRWYGGIKPVAWMPIPEPYREDIE